MLVHHDTQTQTRCGSLEHTLIYRLLPTFIESTIESMPFSDSDDEDEDARKPAAQPTTTRISLESHPDEPVATTQSTPCVLPVEGEVPFLVTHWLSGFALEHENSLEEKQPEQQAALAKIRQSAADLARAFEALGSFGQRRAFGVCMPQRHEREKISMPFNAHLFSCVRCVSFPQPTGERSGPTATKRVTYADMKRTWSSCGSHQLEHLLQSTKSAATVVDATLRRNAPIHRVPAASAEAVRNGAVTKASAAGAGGGRTLQDAIVVTDENNNNDSSERGSGGGATDLSWEQAAAISVLQSPLHWMEPPALAERNADPSLANATRASSFSQQPSRAVVLTSGNQEMSSKAANSMRHYLELRTQCQNESTQIRSMQRSMQHQHDTLARLEKEQWQSLTARSSALPSSEDVPTMLDEVQSAQLTAERVVAQLQRQLPLLEATHATTLRRMQAARHAALADYAAARCLRQDYRDPMSTANIVPPQSLRNRTILNLVHRQVGTDRCLGRSVPRTMGRIRLAGSMVEDRQALLHHRFSHAATINTHLSYPVYCLRLDRTGRYFITGSDDYLVKIFCLGGNIVGASSHERGRLDPAMYARGAVLVCTLKGHSGVINDIGVSSDNCFLATASADGDCRVWCLKDGCPVAILRGHLGGANMVRLTLPSWSILRRPFFLLELTNNYLLGLSRYHGPR
jgi:WD domain, G-beta repeat